MSPEHPLAIVLRDFENRGYPTRFIKLEPLTVEAINELCSEALGRKNEDTLELVSLLHSKTDGSPFFVKQFIENLYDRGCIYLNRVNRIWTWDIEKVKKASFTENVVDFIQEKLHKFDPDVQSVLKIAACLGQSFEANDIVKLGTQERGLDIRCTKCSRWSNNHY